MDRIKRFIDIYIPVESCSLRCHYCYITHHRLFDNKLPVFKYSPQIVRKGLSQERLGGVCMLNLCGGGETLLPPEMPEYIRELLEEGHYVMVVTNGTVSRAFDELAKLPLELQKHLFFKFSFHYLQLKERNLFSRFWTNVKKMRDAGASFTIEITPSDELIPHIDDIKAMTQKEVGALCHVTVARDEHYLEKPILTSLSKEEYQKIWAQFESQLFDYKLSVFGQERKEFCYAGDWTFTLDLGTGMMQQCYCSYFKQNILDDPTAPIQFRAIGSNCKDTHCFNAHGWLGFGAIPEHTSPYFDQFRNRTCIDQTEWLSESMKLFMHQKLKENNKEYSSLKKHYINCYWQKLFPTIMAIKYKLSRLR